MKTVQPNFANSSSALLRAELEAAHWLGTTPLLDLSDDRLRMRTMALTQLAKNDRERALAVYAFVKRIKFGYPISMSLPTARQVMDASVASNFGKSNLFVSMLRCAGVPARIRMLQLRGDVQLGLYAGLARSNHAVVEVWLDSRWVRTDTHSFDTVYLASARAQLEANGWDRGFGIVRHANAVWNGREDAFSAFSLDDSDCMPLSDFGVFNDTHEYLSNYSVAAGAHALGILRGVRFQAVASMMNRGIQKLRKQDFAGQLATV